MVLLVVVVASRLLVRVQLLAVVGRTLTLLLLPLVVGMLLMPLLLVRVRTTGRLARPLPSLLVVSGKHLFLHYSKRLVLW